MLVRCRVWTTHFKLESISTAFYSLGCHPFSCIILLAKVQKETKVMETVFQETVSFPIMSSTSSHQQ